MEKRDPDSRATLFIYLIQLKYFDIAAREIKTHDEAILKVDKPLFAITFTQHNMLPDTLENAFVSLVHDQHISLRKLW
jgi:hypothetical protein